MVGPRSRRAAACTGCSWYRPAAVACGWELDACCAHRRVTIDLVRAGVGICGLLAILASRPSDGWLLWLAPAAWLLTMNPNNLFDVSFQLSFGAVVGLLVLARPLTRAASCPVRCRSRWA